VVLWTISEPLLSIWDDSLGSKVPIYVVVTIFILPILVYIINRLFFQHSCEQKDLKKSVKRAIKKGLDYLETNNVNKNGQRFRHIPSLLESATVIGAIYLAKDTLKIKHYDNIQTLTWLTNSLKKQFSNNGPVKYFDCYKCQNYQICNVGYFDYLSHFYYAKNTVLYEKLTNEFYFLIDIFESRMVKYNQLVGWTLYEEESREIDPFSTAGILILLDAFRSPMNKNINYILNSLVKSQDKDGSWKRSFSIDGYCGGSLDIITTHRVIEALSLYKEHLSKGVYERVVKNAIKYLKSSSGQETPVNYEIKSGVLEKELLRGLGHIVQALVKVGDESKMIEDYIKFIVCKQKEDGSYIGASEVLDDNRITAHNTDLTAFITRTLCIYYNRII
jgi:hypothetical protein